MNKSDLDNLFRDKLGHHEMPAGPETWDKLKGNLEGNRKKGLLIYWRVAAIIVMAIGSILFLFQLKPGDTNTAANIDGDKKDIPTLVEDVNKDNQIVASTDIGKTEEIIEEPNMPTEKEAIALAVPQEQQSVENIQKDKASDKSQNQGKLVAEPKRETVKKEPQKATPLLANNASIKEESITEENKAEELMALANTASALMDEENEQDKVITKTITPDEELVALVDKLPNTNEQADKIESAQSFEPQNITITFKKEDNQMQDAFVENKNIPKNKKFGLKTMISLAKDIKNAELGISNLRAKKDELLAKNFSKKKNVKISK